MTQLAINTVLGPISGTPPFDLPARVLHIDHSGVATLITIEESPRRPWRMEVAARANLLRANELAIVRMQVPDFMLALDSELPASHCAKRDALWKKILPLVEASKYGEFFSEGRMGPLISSIAEKTGTKKKPMYTLLYRAVSNTKRNTGLINSVGRML